MNEASDFAARIDRLRKERGIQVHAQPGATERPAIADALTLIRTARVKPHRDLTLVVQLEAAQAAMKKFRRQMGSIGRAFLAEVPAPLREAVTVGGYQSGTLTLWTRSSAAKFTMDRWLRAGGTTAIQRACAAPIKRIVLKEGVPSGVIPESDRPPVPELAIEERIELEQQLPLPEEDES